MKHVRAVINQSGIALELHEHAPKPITLALIRPSELEAYRNDLARLNPDFKFATIGQLAINYAQQLCVNVPVDPSPWTYNASAETYERAI